MNMGDHALVQADVLSRSLNKITCLLKVHTRRSAICVGLVPACGDQMRNFG